MARLREFAAGFGLASVRALALIGFLAVPGASPAAAQEVRCTADCDGDLRVGVDEVIRCVDRALANDGDACAACDRGGDGAVDVDELVRGVANSIGGCPPDLLPTSASLSVEPMEGCVPDTSQITTELVVCVANRGGRASGAFDVEVNGEDFASVSGIDADQEECFTGQLSAGSIDVFADSGETILEDDEDNNIAIINVGQPTLPPLCTPTATPTSTAEVTVTGTPPTATIAIVTATVTAGTPTEATPTATDTPSPTGPVPSETPTPTATDTPSPTSTGATATASITSTPGTPTPGLPDLVPVTIAIDAPTPIGGCGPAPPITLSVFIENQSDSPAGEFDVTLNGQLIGRVGPIGATAQISIDTPLVSGDLTVVADSSHEIDESDEDNNTQHFFVPFFTPPPDCTVTGTPTATATGGGAATATATITSSATVVASATATPTATAVTSPTTTATQPATATATLVPSSTASATQTSTPSATSTHTAAPSPTVTSTPLPSATPTVTPTSTPTPTATTPPDTLAIDPIAPSAAVFAKAFSLIPIVAGAIAQGDHVLGQPLSFGANGGGAGGCAVNTMCTPQGGATIESTITFPGCVLDAQGGFVELGGSIALTGQGSCLDPIPVPSQGTADISLTVTVETSVFVTLLTASLNVTDNPYSITRSAVIGGNCNVGLQQIDGLDMTLTGTLAFDFAGIGPSAMLDLHSLEVALAINVLDLACLPVDYTMTINGQPNTTDVDVGLEVGVNSLGFQADFNDLTMAAQVSDDETSVDLEGPVDAICYNGIANLTTPVNLVQSASQLCPSTGTLRVLGNGQFFYSNGGVGIDDDLNGTIDRPFNSCFDKNLFGCVG